MKISKRREEFENERGVYTWLANVKTASYVPHLYFGDKYGYSLPYYGLVLTKLGPDLQTLVQGCCRNNRFTPRMTLAVAIQTVSIYPLASMAQFPDIIDIHTDRHLSNVPLTWVAALQRQTRQLCNRPRHTWSEHPDNDVRF